MKNILVTRLRFMGDIILTTPLLAALNQAYPEAAIYYLAESPYLDLLKGNPHLAGLIALDKKRSPAPLLAQLIRRRYDLAIDLFGNPRSALLTWLSGAAMRIGGDFRGRRHFYTHPVANDGSPKTAIEFHLSYLAPLKIPAINSNAQIFVLPEEQSWAKEYLITRGFDLKRPIIGIHPGATWPAKRWFPDRFAQLANRLAEEGQQLLFTTGPGEKELVDSILSQCAFHPIRPELLLLRQLAALLQQLDVYVSNDCGPLHLAPAVGTKTVGIFGPGQPDIWFPYDEKSGHRLVFHQIDCSRCHRDLCEKMDCMKAIQVEEVFQNVKDALIHSNGK